MVTLDFERSLWDGGVRLVAGVDEAGRGPLAGPVVAAAVFFPKDVVIEGVDDSKVLTPAKREYLYDEIIRRALSFGVASVPSETIDRINIFRATMEAMAQAVSRLAPSPGHILVDGPHYRDSTIPWTPVIDGDARCFAIAAASIIAKVTRDRMMSEFDRIYPLYGFAKHKGYGTKEHREAIGKYGLCDIHRRSFRMSAEAGAHADQ